MKTPISSTSRFEAMDRISNICQIIGMMLEDHPAVVDDSRLFELVDKAMDCMGAAYQRAGTLYFDAVDTDTP